MLPNPSYLKGDVATVPQGEIDGINRSRVDTERNFTIGSSNYTLLLYNVTQNQASEACKGKESRLLFFWPNINWLEKVASTAMQLLKVVKGDG